MYHGRWDLPGRSGLMRRVASVGGFHALSGRRTDARHLQGVVVPEPLHLLQGVLPVQALARQRRFGTFDMSSVMSRGRLLDALRHSACSEANVRFMPVARWACCG